MVVKDEDGFGRSPMNEADSDALADEDGTADDGDEDPAKETTDELEEETEDDVLDGDELVGGREDVVEVAAGREEDGATEGQLENNVSTAAVLGGA